MLFKNKWSYVHFFGMMALMAAWYQLSAASVTTMERTYSAILLVIVALAPYLYEEWDRKKVLYSDPRAKLWGWFAKALFTSEGLFDENDMLLGYAGMGIGLILSIIFL